MTKKKQYVWINVYKNKMSNCFENQLEADNHHKYYLQLGGMNKRYGRLKVLIERRWDR